VRRVCGEDGTRDAAVTFADAVSCTMVNAIVRIRRKLSSNAGGAANRASKPRC